MSRLSNIALANVPDVTARVAREPGKAARIFTISPARKRVLFASAESRDFVQAGGLGAVAADLPRALAPSCDARVILPGYPAALRAIGDLDIVAHLPGVGAIPPCSIGAARLPDGLFVYLVLCSELYDRPGSPYVDPQGAEFADNDIRFGRLSLAIAQLAESGAAGWRPDIVHLNDWPTALAAGYLAWRGAGVPTLLTVHNLAHQGLFDVNRREALGIPASAFGLTGVEFYGQISFLKAGLNYAHHVTTVSETYAEEITHRECGAGLDGVLKPLAREGRLTGIVNGVDKSWDPRTDKRCPYLFDPQRWKGRYADFIRGAFGLSLARAPLFAFVARLVHQKGVDLMIEATDHIVALGGQLVVVGRGEPEMERQLTELARRHPDAVGVRIGFDPEEARALFAGADFLLMPSRFEPCGLSQMYAQRYGALPIARRTGGLAETIEPGKTGILFERAEVSALEAAISQACGLYGEPKTFHAMRRAAMARDFSWEGPARAYAALYREIETRGA